MNFQFTSQIKNKFWRSNYESQKKAPKIDQI